MGYNSIPAKQGRYLGTVHTIAGIGGSVEDSGGGISTAAIGKRFVWNLYNREPRSLKKIYSGVTYSYTTDTYQPAGNNDITTRVEIVVGIPVAWLSLRVADAAANSPGGCRVNANIDEDGITTGDATQGLRSVEAGAGFAMNAFAWMEKYPTIGYHFYQWLQKSQASNTTTWLTQVAGETNPGLYGFIMG